MAISIGKIMINHGDQAEYRYPIFTLKWVIAKRWKLSLHFSKVDGLRGDRGCWSSHVLRLDPEPWSQNLGSFVSWKQQIWRNSKTKTQGQVTVPSWNLETHRRTAICRVYVVCLLLIGISTEGKKVGIHVGGNDSLHQWPKPRSQDVSGPPRLLIFDQLISPDRRIYGCILMFPKSPREKSW